MTSAEVAINCPDWISIPARFLFFCEAHFLTQDNSGPEKKVRPNSKWVPGHLEVELQLITLLIGVNYNPSHWLSIAVLMVIARWWLSV